MFNLTHAELWSIGTGRLCQHYFEQNSASEHQELC